MKWIKRGLIFEPARHGLVEGCIGFAQSPQALVREDHVRVYFSTRRVDGAGTYLSHVGYADFDLGMTTVLRAATVPVLPLGELGCYDEHGIFPFHVLRHEGTVYGYISGWSRRVAVPVETAIGLAVSDDDGESFRRLGPGPVLGPSLTEPFLVGDPFVLVDGATWHMWYIFGTRWIGPVVEGGQPDRVYKVAHATSRDGIAWERDGACRVPDRLGPDECQALPTVLRRPDGYHLVFCYRHATDFRRNRDRGYRLGYAHSADGSTWRRDDALVGIDVTPGAWDADMMCYPHLFSCAGRVYLMYNGNEFGRHGFGLAELDETG